MLSEQAVSYSSISQYLWDPVVSFRVHKHPPVSSVHTCRSQLDVISDLTFYFRYMFSTVCFFLYSVRICHFGTTGRLDLTVHDPITPKIDGEKFKL